MSNYQKLDLIPEKMKAKGTEKWNRVLVNNVKVNYKIGKRRKGDVIIAFADVSKIKQNIGWACKHSVNDALKSSWFWEKNLRDE